VLEQTNYPLTIMATPGDALQLRVGYDARRFDEETIGRLVDHLGNVLEAFADDPGRRLADVPLMSRSEQVQLLRGGEGDPPGPDALLEELDRLSTPELDGLIARYLGTEEASHE
jgi:non-ribosomal peptide synthetase component F